LIGRVKGDVGAAQTPIGALPHIEDVSLDGVALSEEARGKLFGFDRDAWRAEVDGIGSYLDKYGQRMPEALKSERSRISAELMS